MSRIRADKISNKAGTGAVQLQYGAEVPVGYGITGAGTINVTGVITAASFAGSGANLTGIDATSIKDSGGNVKIQAQSSGAMYTGIHTFLGNVSVGGTLTYEDVTNVDAVGLITARNGINVSGGTATFAGAIDANGNLDVDGSTSLDSLTVDDDATFNGATTNMVWDKSDSKLKFNNILNIYNKDGSSRIDGASGGMFFKATGAYVWSNNSLGTRFEALDSSCLLYANGAKIARSSTSGFQVGNPDGGVGIAVTIGINGNAVFGGTGIVTATAFKLPDGSTVGGVTSDAQYNTVGGTNSGDGFTGNNASNNTLFGYDTGTDISSGDDNTCIGYRSGEDISTGGSNTLIGSVVGERITTTGSNTGVGYMCMAEVTGGDNTAVGAWALKDSSNCNGSVAIGNWALYSNAGGDYNIGVGYDACRGNYSNPADYKIGIGYQALRNARGNYNIGIGYRSGSDALGNVYNTGTHNITIGHESGHLLSSGSDNTIMGPNAGDALASGSNNLILGHDAAASSTTASNEITLGDANITSIRIPGISLIADAADLIFGGNLNLSEGKKTIFGSNSGNGAYIKHQSGNFELKNQTGNFYFDNVGALHFRTGASYTTALTINPNQSCTFTAGVNIGPGVLAEKFHNDTGGGITSNYTHSVLTYGMVWYGSTNAAGAWTFNVQGDGSTTLNGLMAIGETTTMTMYSANNNASNYMTAFKVDGSTITVKWAGGTAPSAATGSGTDVYSMTIMKTANATFTVFGNFTNFA